MIDTTIQQDHSIRNNAVWRIPFSRVSSTRRTAEAVVSIQDKVARRKQQQQQQQHAPMKTKRRGKKVSANSIAFGCFGCCALLFGLGEPLWFFFRHESSVGSSDWQNRADAVVAHVHTPPNPTSSVRKPPTDTTSTSIDAAAAASITTGTAGFVHMGKTAGSTLSLLLRNGCHSFVNPKPCHTVPNETMVSKLVGAYYHIPDFQHLKDSDHSMYILSVRDVYDRFVSSLLYQHPKNVEYYHVTMTRNIARAAPMAYKCFPTLEVFASWLKRGNSTDCDYPYPHYEIVNENCAELACAATHGRVRHFVHLFFNYHEIYSRIPTLPPQRKLYVIRKEHLWDDWWKVNRMFGEQQRREPVVSSEAQRNITGIQLPVTRDISDQGRSKLCKALEEEYSVYFRILQRAENMDAIDLDDARTVASGNCPDLDFHSILAASATH